MSMITNQSSSVTKVFSFVDWLPAIGNLKALVDFYFKNFAFPSDFSRLSFFSKEYFKHLSEKEDWRYVSIVPYVGNALVAVGDIGSFASKRVQSISSGNRLKSNMSDNEIETHASNIMARFRTAPAVKRQEAIDKAFHTALSGSGSEQKASWQFLFKVLKSNDVAEKNKVHAWFQANIKNYKYYDLTHLYKMSNTPTSLKRQIHDFYIEKLLAGSFDEKYALLKIFKNLNQAEKGRIIGEIQRAAENGNKKGYEFLIDRLLRGNSEGVDSLFQWLTHLAKTPNSLLHKEAWSSLGSIYYIESTLLKQKAFNAYLDILRTSVQSPEMSKKISNFIFVTCVSANAAEKTQIRAALLQLAQSGNAEPQFLAGKFLASENNVDQAIPYLERAANANHLKAIILLGTIYCEKKLDFDRAIFWYEKAAGRDPQIQRLVTQLKQQRESQRDRQRRNEGFRRTQQESDRFRQRAQQERADAETAQRNNAATELAEATRKLEEIFGAKFSTLAELTRAYRFWAQKGGHPDKGGSTEKFQEMQSLMESIKTRKGWN